MQDNTKANDDYLIVNNSQINQTQREIPKIFVEPCSIEFFYKRFKQSYPMYKNPRGLCLIINIYQIDGMPPRRWSDRDTETLRQLFEQLLFKVKIFTDSTHDLSCQNFKNTIKEFSQDVEHQDSQCCVVCLMSHGEEGYLTTKEGDKVLLDDIFSMFNNINCPNLAGKPKLFFIQSCRDDPILGPAEDLGIRLSINCLKNNERTTSSGNLEKESASKQDENDGKCNRDETVAAIAAADHNANNENERKSASNPSTELTNSLENDSYMFYHIPSLCDMLVGFPTQKGYIAYRKPEIGSWYMNAIVQIFSKHSCDTDLCAMLNMVNSMISNEVTNTGKKQMSEFTSKLTKPYFYFFPGLATDSSEDESNECLESSEALTKKSQLNQKDSNQEENNKLEKFKRSKPCHENDEIGQELCKKHKTGIVESYTKTTFACLENEYLAYDSTGMGTILNDQNDSNYLKLERQFDETNYLLFSSKQNQILNEYIEFVARRANVYWKQIARQISLNESQINQIDKDPKLTCSDEKLLFSLKIWLKKQNNGKENHLVVEFYHKVIETLNACRLNKIKDEVITKFNRCLI